MILVYKIMLGIPTAARAPRPKQNYPKGMYRSKNAASPQDQSKSKAW